MSKFNLSIPSPCHEHWEQMTPADQGRFCSSCQKTVIDFTGMTDQQLAAFFKKPAGNVCGRFAQDQLEREITVPTKRIPWVRYFFQFTLPAFLLSLKAGAQKEGRVETVQQSRLTGDSASKETVQASAAISSLRGKVIDDRGFPIPYATIILKGAKQATACDAEGNFNLPYQQTLPLILQVSSVGYESREFLVTDSSAKDLVMATLPAQLMGEVVIVRRAKTKKKYIPLISNSSRDTAFNQFSIYPNPARSHGNLTLDCKMMAKGIYTLQLLTVDGKTAMSKQLELDKKGGLLRTDLPALTAGQYVLTLRHNATGKVYTEKIQVL